MNEKIRYHMLDEFRGFIFLNMVAYHALWDLVYMYGVKADWYRNASGDIWQKCVCCCFIFLSGFCWQLGKKPLKRGLLVFGAGIVITAVTMLVMPDARVIFGVLTFHGSAMLLFIPLSKILKKIPAQPGAVVSILLFLFTYTVNDGYLGFFGRELVKLPESLYANWLTTYLGFPEKSFWSTDYFSIFPWIFLYITGYFVHTIIIRKKQSLPEGLKKSLCPPLGFIGKHSLLIYMLHQPVIYGICMLIFGY